MLAGRRRIRGVAGAELDYTRSRRAAYHRASSGSSAGQTLASEFRLGRGVGMHAVLLHQAVVERDAVEEEGHAAAA